MAAQLTRVRSIRIHRRVMNLNLVFLVGLTVSYCCVLPMTGAQDSYYSFYRQRSRELQADQAKLGRQPSQPLSRSSSRPSLRRSQPKRPTFYPGPKTPGYLDPKNFQLPEMTVAQMRVILREIEMHIRPKENNLEFYSGARLLILLLQEECFRLRQSGDPRVNQFCNSFSNRFRSFF